MTPFVVAGAILVLAAVAQSIRLAITRRDWLPLLLLVVLLVVSVAVTCAEIDRNRGAG
jgi:hypothetical protein